jgi:hypothetical protein
VLFILLLNSAIALDCSSPKYSELCTLKRISIFEKSSTDNLDKERTEECLAKGLAIISSSKKSDLSKKYLDKKIRLLKIRVDKKLNTGFSSEEERQSFLIEAETLDKKIEWYNNMLQKLNQTVAYFDYNCSGKFMDDSPSELTIDLKVEYITKWIME